MITMKKFITMILAIAMVITSVVVPTDKVKASEVNNKNSWNSMTDNDKDDIFSPSKVKPTYAKISYDKHGNLVGKVKIKNFNKKKIKFTIDKEAKIRLRWRNEGEGAKRKDYRIKKKGIAKRFTLEKGQSKTITVKIPKSKIKGKYYNLREVDTEIHIYYTASWSGKRKYMRECCCGSMTATIKDASWQEAEDEEDEF